MGTKAIIFSKRSQTSKVEERESLVLAQTNIEYAHSYKCLGFILDHFSYNLHTKDLSKKHNYDISILQRIKPYVSTDNLKLISNSIVKIHFEYCATLLHKLNKSQIDLLLKIQKSNVPDVQYRLPKNTHKQASVYQPKLSTNPSGC